MGVRKSGLEANGTKAMVTQADGGADLDVIGGGGIRIEHPGAPDGSAGTTFDHPDGWEGAARSRRPVYLITL